MLELGKVFLKMCSPARGYRNGYDFNSTALLESRQELDGMRRTSPPSQLSVALLGGSRTLAMPP